MRNDVIKLDMVLATLISNSSYPLSEIFLEPKHNIPHILSFIMIGKTTIPETPQFFSNISSWSLKKSARYTIFLMVLIGVMAYSGINDYMTGMQKTADKFYSKTNLQDLNVLLFVHKF